MKTLHLFSAVGLCAGALLTAAYAESHARIKVDVPFQFKAGDVNFQAGNYTVAMDSMPGLIWIHDQQNAQSAYMQFHATILREPSKQPNMMFHRYGDQYFLESISKSGAYRLDVAKCRIERELERSGARPAVTMLIGRLR